MVEVGAAVAPGMSVVDNSHVSRSLPRKGSGIEKIWDKFNASGQPIFEGSRDVREFTAKTEGLFDYD